MLFASFFKSKAPPPVSLASQEQIWRLLDQIEPLVPDVALDGRKRKALGRHLIDILPAPFG
jgi:hypothetical protein